MKRKNLLFTLATMAGLSLASLPAHAEGLSEKLNNLQISGFVDAAYYDTDAAGSTGALTLDQVELDIAYSEDNIGLRFDLQVLPSAGGALLQDTAIEQGYIFYTFPGEAGATFTFGKFNAPIGWELLDAPDMYQYSHALVFDNGLPTNLTGASLAASYGMVDGVVYISNGTDLNGASGSGLKTYGGRLGITPIEGLNIGLSYISGDNISGVTQNPRFALFDIDFTYDGIENLVIGGEFNDGRNWTAANTKSQGWFLVAHYDFTDMFGVTGRVEQWDADRNATGKMIEYTGALTAALGGGLGALFELRQDKSTAVGGTTVNSYAYEMTYSF